MRYALVTFVLDAMNTFLIDMGLELSELASQSATLQNLRNTICQWQNVAHTQLSLFANRCPPDDYIPRNIDNDVNDHLHSSHHTQPSMGIAGGVTNAASFGTGCNRPVANDLFHADAHPFRSVLINMSIKVADKEVLRQLNGLFNVIAAWIDESIDDRKMKLIRMLAVLFYMYCRLSF